MLTMVILTDRTLLQCQTLSYGISQTILLLGMPSILPVIDQYTSFVPLSPGNAEDILSNHLIYSTIQQMSLYLHFRTIVWKGHEMFNQ